MWTKKLKTNPKQPKLKQTNIVGSCKEVGPQRTAGWIVLIITSKWEIIAMTAITILNIRPSRL